jgi:hypothetical protein
MDIDDNSNIINNTPGLPEDPNREKIQIPPTDGLRRMCLPMRTAPYVPTPRFMPSNLSMKTVLASSILMCLPLNIKELIWTYVFEYRHSRRLQKTGHIEFSANHGICNLPDLTVSPKLIVQELNRITASKGLYNDASSVFFSKILPKMVSEVHSIEDYCVLEKYVLRDCPSHFVRFSQQFTESINDELATYHLQLRTMVVDTEYKPITCLTNFKNNKEMLDQAVMAGWFPPTLQGGAWEYDRPGLPFNHRPPPMTILRFLTVDGEIGSIYWWIHAYFDQIYCNRTNWPAIQAILYDFTKSMQRFVETEGILFPGKTRFGCVMASIRRYSGELERQMVHDLAGKVLQSWKVSRQM